MGTRGLTKVIDAEGVIKVAQYGQWDHYPEGQGITILNFLNRDVYAVGELEQSLDKCYFVSAPDRELIYAEYQDKYGDSTHLKKFSAMLPSLSRDTGGDILNVIRWSAGKVPLVDESDFENDDLFCEGVYTINYQTKKFVTKFAGVTMELPLDDLPTQEVYLSRFSRLSINDQVDELV